VLRREQLLVPLAAQSSAARRALLSAQLRAQSPAESPTSRVRDFVCTYRVSGTPRIVIRTISAWAPMPSSGVTYYEVPREYGVANYRYTVVNDRTVLVDPGTHRIVEIID
jgi:uncharacterized protein DUF1236